MPFLATDSTQLDRRWLAAGYGVEALFLHADQLRELGRVCRLLRALAVPATIHFPMNGAAWLAEPPAAAALREVLEAAVECGARGVVAHANWFVDVADVPTADLVTVRRRCLDRLAELDALLEAAAGPAAPWLGIENMPLVGDDGDDTDAVFVYPADLTGVRGRHLGAVLDTAHWIGTLDTLAIAGSDPAARRYLPAVRPAGLDDWAPLAAGIRHLHVSAVRGVAVPPGRGRALGGGVPTDSPRAGDYARLVRGLASVPTVSLEVAEDDYRDRRALWRTLDWLRSVVEVPPPATAVPAGTP